MKQTKVLVRFINGSQTHCDKITFDTFNMNIDVVTLHTFGYFVDGTDFLEHYPISQVEKITSIIYPII